MASKLLAAGRIFASHYQIVLCSDPSEVILEEENWSEESTGKGFAGNSVFRMIGTEGDLNDHWVELYATHQLPELDAWQRVTCLDFTCKTGWAHVMSVVDAEPLLNVTIPKGEYTAFICAQNLGVDQEALGEQGELTDDQLAARRDLERYRIYLMRGAPRKTGRLVDHETPLPADKQAR